MNKLILENLVDVNNLFTLNNYSMQIKLVTQVFISKSEFLSVLYMKICQLTFIILHLCYLFLLDILSGFDLNEYKCVLVLNY